VMLIFAFRNFSNAPKFQYFACKPNLWVSIDSENKQTIFHYSTELTDTLEMKARCLT
jgi:hypothetical protein